MQGIVKVTLHFLVISESNIFNMSKIKNNIEFMMVITYNDFNRTQHASRRCGPRWVI